MLLGAMAAACLGMAMPAGADITMPWLYKAPKFVKPITSKPAQGSRVNVVASTLTYNQNTKIAVATGSVVLTYGPYTLTATKVVYNMNNGHFSANGSVILKEPNGNVSKAPYAEIYDKFKQGFARHVTALLTNDVTVTADYARRYENGITIYTRATYTACQACVTNGGTPIWQIRARQAKHDENDHTIYYTDMNFDIADVPVFWLPYLAYPDPTVTRRTGFLLPQFEAKSAYGFGVETPFFWAVSPSSDLTVTPMWNTGQGVLGQAEWRQRLASGLYSIDAYGIYQLNPSQATGDYTWRGALRSKGDLKLDSTWTLGWNGTWQSDRYFLNDYSIDSSDLFTSNIHLTGVDDRSYVNVEAIQYDTALSSILKDGSLNREDQRFLPTVAPYVTASTTLADPVLGGEVSADFNAYALHRSDAVSFTDTDTFLGTDQDRAVANLHWQRQMINGLGQVITPFAALRSDVYVSYNVPGAPSGEQTTADILPSVGLDMRWPLIAATGNGQSIVTPVAQIISSPLKQDTSLIGNEDSKALNFDTSNLFLEDHSSGYDTYETGTRANLGLMYSYLFDDGGFIRASAGYTQHIAGANIYQPGSGLNTAMSDLVAGVAYQPNDHLRLTYQARMAPDLARLDMQEASAGLTLDRFVGTLSYADVTAAPAYGIPNRESQVWVEAAYRLATSWSIFGDLRYDVMHGALVDKSIGIVFDCDCMTAKLAYTDHTGQALGDTSERKLMLSITFRTIGTFDGNFNL